MAVLEVFADVACPFTHVGLRRFVAARAERGLGEIRLRVRAWPLEVVNGVPLARELVAHEVADIHAQVAPDLFGGFDPGVFPATSIPAFGLAAAAYDRDLATGEAVSLALRDALFEEGRDVTDPAVLGELGRRHGIDPLPPDEARERVRADHREGVERGVIGSPFFFVGRQGRFCPTLRISKEGDHYRVEWDRDAFEDLFAELRRIVGREGADLPSGP
ncbi:MAG: DsbA family protein [Acidimicrobiia bacterium]